MPGGRAVSRGDVPGVRQLHLPVAGPDLQEAQDRPVPDDVRCQLLLYLIHVLHAPLGQSVGVVCVFFFLFFLIQQSCSRFPAVWADGRCSGG